MKYSQKVIIRNIDYQKVRKAFQSIRLVEFLTYLQPIKIIEWSGIEVGKIAYFKLWLLGWRNFKVIHTEYQADDNYLFFVDEGVDLPLGINSWKHNHRIIKDKNNTIIEDSLSYSHVNNYMSYILFPILIFPILIRKILYRIYFFNTTN